MENIIDSLDIKIPFDVVKMPCETYILNVKIY